MLSFADYLRIALGKTPSTTGVVDELREMAREVVPDADDQEERDIALGKFGSFNRSSLRTYYWLPALERSLEGIKSYLSRNEMSAAPMAL